MNHMTNEQYEALKPFEGVFKTSIDAKYVRCQLRKDVEMMKAIYDEITGTHKAVNFGCNHCAMKFYQDLGKLYFAEKERRSKEFLKALEEVLDDGADEGTEPTTVENNPAPKPKKRATKTNK